jgi:hypothetical protein
MVLHCATSRFEQQSKTRRKRETATFKLSSLSLKGARQLRIISFFLFSSPPLPFAFFFPAIQQGREKKRKKKSEWWWVGRMRIAGMMV